MRMYLEVMKKSFQNNIVYRLDYFAGLINAVIMILVNIAIWKAIYEEQEVLDGVQFKILVTYLVLSFIMQSLFVMNEYVIESRVRSGLISTDLIKPMNFKMYIFSRNIGTVFFRIVMQMVPALIISIILFRILPPFSFTAMLFFSLSFVLGYLVLYNLNFIVWLSTFWFYWTFSLVTIKDAFVMILSGALLPLWFMPQNVLKIVNLTPFDSIYYIPISIYLGQMPQEEIVDALIRQGIWVGILFAVGQVLWKIAVKKLVVQGG